MDKNILINMMVYSVGFVIMWGIPIYCAVKFYKMLSSINDNLAGIRQEAERIGTNTPAIGAGKF